jgi:hypothetical protein
MLRKCGKIKILENRGNKWKLQAWGYKEQIKFYELLLSFKP